MSGNSTLIIFIAVLLSERAFELLIARRNELWILQKGGREIAAGFSKLIVVFHVGWFAGFLLEGIAGGRQVLTPLPFAVLALLVLQAARYWCIRSLGPYWNTKVMILPGASLHRRGPYKWFRHPNYLVVIIEIALYPALFGCFWTAAVGSAINAFLLKKRMAQEEAALKEHTNYQEIFAKIAYRPN